MAETASNAPRFTGGRRDGVRAQPVIPHETATGDALDPRRWWALVVIALSQLMIVLDASVVVVALPAAQHALHISEANRQWVLTAYTLAFGSLLLLGGRIADYAGRRRTFVVGLLGFGAASALGGLAQDPAMLFGARALQGGFAALMAPSALSILTVTFTETRERARAFGVYGGIAGGGAAIGLVLGGTLTQLASWRWTLLINAPIAVVAVLGAIRVVRRDRAVTRVARGYDLPGAFTATAGLFLLVLGFSAANTHGWTAGLTLALIAGGVALLAAFVAVELRAANPLLPLRVVLDANRGGAYLSSLLVGIALLGTFLFLTYFLQGTLHYSALKTGFAFLPFSGGIIVGASLSSRFLPRTGPRRLMAIGLLMACAGLVWFTRLTVASSFPADLLPAELVVSIGMGLTFVPMSSTALFGVDPRAAGVASALVNTAQQVGGALGTSLLNTVAASATAGYLATRLGQPGATAVATVHGFTVGFAVSASLVGAAALVAASLIRGSRHVRDGALPPDDKVPALALVDG
jgi:EmrB/QacA subfamily drug resistance transporter